ncbi:MAG: DUF6804 family protein [Candidatus Njordarchaeales archaeon]
MRTSRFTILRITAALMLLFALGAHPYAYYQLLRWVVCSVTGYGAFLAYKQKRNEWAWIFGIIAILFNPIVPFYLSREIWSLLDIGVSSIILISLFFFKIKQPRKRSFY